MNPSSSPNEPPSDPFPGWYPDPLRMADQRFWNGREWTGTTKRSEEPADHPPDLVVRAVPEPPSSPGPSAPDGDGNEVDDGASSTGGPGAEAPTSPSPERRPLFESVVARAPLTATSELESRPRIFGSVSAAKTVETPAARPAPFQIRVPKPIPEPLDADPERQPAATVQPAASVQPAATTQPVPVPVPLPTPGSDPVVVHALGLDEGATDGKASLEDVLATMPGRGTRSAQPVQADFGHVDPPGDGPMHPTPSPDGTTGRPSAAFWAILVVGLLAALAVGFLAGRSSGGDASSSEIAATPISADAPEASTATQIDEDSPAGNDAVDGQEALLQAEIDSLTSEREALSAELDAAVGSIEEITVERDDALDHNELMQTWFTAEVRDRSERDWNNEVDRACSADSEPTLDNTNHTRSMELMGTHEGLVRAVLECRAAG